MTTRKTNDGIEILKQRFGIDPASDPNVQAFAEHFRIAQMVYDARTAAGLTQKALADAVGVAESNIADMEDADFQGDELSMLRRIAEALHLKLHVELVPAGR
jgi:ribosome-binding protein aMBF1 (putative translation factor)